MNLDIETYLAQNQAKADKYMQFFVVLFFVFGVAIAPIYQTWLFALGIGSINMILFFVATFLLKNKYFGRMIVSAIFALYMLQFIGQMHGMAELHFFFFINIAILIGYQDWRLMIPYTIIAVGHHSVFFALQIQGIDGLGTYFINYTKVTYVTLIFHFGLAILMAVVCGLWALLFRNASYQIVVMGRKLQQQNNNMQENIQDNMDFLLAISRGDFSKELNPKTDIDYALLKTKNILEEASQQAKIENARTKRLLKISEALRNHHDVSSLGKSVVHSLLNSFSFVCISIYQFKKNENIEIEEENSFLKHGTLHLIAQQGCAKNIPEMVFVGEGLLGEVALHQKMYYLNVAQENSNILQSGIGQTKSPHTLIMPMCVNENLVAVMSISSFKTISENDITFLQEMSESIARAIVAVETLNQNEKLLLESQNITQELLTTEEELRQNLEEVNAMRDTMEDVTFELTLKLQDKDQKIKNLENQVKTLMEVKS